MYCMLHRTVKSSTHVQGKLIMEAWKYIQKDGKDGRMEVRVFNGSMEWPFSASVLLVLPLVE